MNVKNNCTTVYFNVSVSSWKVTTSCLVSARKTAQPKSMEKPEIRPPYHTKMAEPLSNYVREPYRRSKFYHDPFRDFFTPV